MNKNTLYTATAIAALTISFANAAEPQKNPDQAPAKVGATQAKGIATPEAKRTEGKGQGEMKGKMGQSEARGGQVEPIIPQTGDPVVDAQLRALGAEMEAKIKAIREEYQPKFKALIGDRKVKGVGVMSSSTRPVMGSSTRDMIRGEEGRMGSSTRPMMGTGSSTRPMMGSSTHEGMPPQGGERPENKGGQRPRVGNGQVRGANSEQSEYQGFDQMKSLFMGMFGRK